VWWLDDARIHLRAAIGLTPGDDAAARVRRQRKLANLYRDRRELRAAATLLRDVGNDAAAHLAPGHPEAVAVLLAKAELHRLSGDLSAAEARYRDALPHFEEGAFSAGSAAFAALRGLAETVALQGRSDAAEGLVQEGLRRARERASAGFEVARFLGELGRLEVRKGDLATAAALQREALDLLERWLGSAHWEVGHARLELARIAQRQGQSEVALVELGRSARILSRTLAPGHPARSALRRALHETRGAHLARPGVLELHGFDELLQPALFMSVPERWRRSPAI
jgi:tetratricopeptide (TPR) repeat protein